jgi:hypothetical protein
VTTSNLSAPSAVIIIIEGCDIMQVNVMLPIVTNHDIDGAMEVLITHSMTVECHAGIGRNSYAHTAISK